MVAGGEGAASSGRTLASRWRRLGAGVFDLIVIFAAIYLIEKVFGVPLMEMTVTSGESGVASGSSVNFDLNGLLLIGAPYTVITLALLGATPGKYLFGVRVVRDADQGRVGFGRALGRTLASSLSALVIFIGFFWIVFDRKKRGWHDLMAGTVCVLAKDAEDEVPPVQKP